MFFCTNNAASKNIVLLCIIYLYDRLRKYSIQYFKECLFFVSCFFCFLLLSNNTLHVMVYTYIWNVFQYKYIIQITFHVVKQYHARVTSKERKRRFSVIFIYLAWVNFLLGSFAEIDNLNKICNLDNSCKQP